MKGFNFIQKSVYVLILLAIILFTANCNSQDNNANNKGENNAKIRVGVFDGHGGAQTCIWETMEACKLDSQMEVRAITSSDIANKVLDSLDAIIIPGGGGSRQYLNLGEENINKIKQFIADGGGAVGICAGAYLFSNTPNYSCIKINGAKAIDIEHDNRGHGISAFSLTEEGKKLFPEYSSIDTLYCMYYEGPVFVPSDNDTITYIEFATMLSDVHEEGNAPSNMTNNRPFCIGNTFGKGRVISVIAHPEATPGKMWMIPRMVRWCLEDRFELIQTFKNPDIVQDHKLANKEILMSIKDLKKESEIYQVLLYGEGEEKIEALNWLESHFSWDAKRWIQGLLYDKEAKVRARAAKYISNTHYLKYINDVRAAYTNETDSLAKQEIKIAYEHLEKLR